MTEVIVAGGFALVSGCAAVPERPPGDKLRQPQSLGLDTADAPQVAEDWWTSLGDPQLAELVRRGLADNPSLAAALARVQNAQALVSETRAAGYPQIAADADEERRRFSEYYVIPPAFAGRTEWIGFTGLDLSWSLDTFGKQRAEIHKARATLDAALLDARAARLLLAGTIAEVYARLSRDSLLADAAQDTVREREQLLALAAQRFRSGLVTSAVLRDADDALAAARAELIRAEAERDLTLHRIAELTGHGAEAYQIERPHLDSSGLRLPARLPADLLARRADITAARARVDGAVAQQDLARTAFYPDINLSSMAGWAAIGLGPLFSTSALYYGAGPAVHLPIFDAGRLRARYAGANADLAVAVADYNADVLSAVRQAADALSSLHALERQVHEQSTALDAAGANLQLTRTRVQSGLEPQQALLKAEMSVIDARRRYAALAADCTAGRIAVIMAIGGGFTADAQETTTTARAMPPKFRAWSVRREPIG